MSSRSSGGAFERTAPATPEYFEELLPRHQAGDSIRTIAADTGRSRASIARDLARARREERAAREPAPVEVVEPEVGEPEPEPAEHPAERRPGARVFVADDPDLGSGTTVGRLFQRERSSDAQTAARAARELDRLTRRVNLRAGLSPQGDAAYETSTGRGSYDPFDVGDVRRVFRLIDSEDGLDAAKRFLAAANEYRARLDFPPISLAQFGVHGGYAGTA